MNTPGHIGFIMDGNRRWARARGVPTLEGHRKGYLKLLQIIEWGIEYKVPVLSFFAFSTENWKRSKSEVSYLMDLVKLVFTKHLEDFHSKGVKVLVSGVPDGLSEDIQEIIHRAQEKTNKNTKLTIQVCFNYGGRAEIVEAVKQVVSEGIPVGKITEQEITNRLFHQLPDPDIIVRTSGEKRLSNFLTWQSVYSELLFVKKHWPAFSKKDFERVLRVYAQRQRRYGK